MPIKRDIEKYIKSIAKKYEVITITGPRQSGKTTIAKKIFKNKPYVNLEHPKSRSFAQDDPESFLSQYPDGAILDEIQRVPILLSYIQAIVDEKKVKEMFILTGSQQFNLLDSINQSLAGRTTIISLLPYSLKEINSYYKEPPSYDELIFKGSYPKLYEEDIPVEAFMRDYVKTYVERDVREISELKNLHLFQKFLKLCAGRVGQILNYQNLGDDLGVSHNTIREWISILEASYIIYLLPPFFTNIKKQLIKSPKIYFYDTGLAAYLLDIEKEKHLHSHPLRGNLFENLVVNELIKHRYNNGKKNNLCFYRDGSQKEIDIIYNIGNHYLPIEIKSAETFTKDFLKNLDYFEKTFPDLKYGKILVYAANDEQKRQDTYITNPRQMLSYIDALDE
jgi:predicted AAA+ superfamily ATPase